MHVLCIWSSYWFGFKWRIESVKYKQFLIRFLFIWWLCLKLLSVKHDEQWKLTLIRPKRENDLLRLHENQIFRHLEALRNQTYALEISTANWTISMKIYIEILTFFAPLRSYRELLFYVTDRKCDITRGRKTNGMCERYLVSKHWRMQLWYFCSTCNRAYCESRINCHNYLVICSL